MLAGVLALALTLVTASSNLFSKICLYDSLPVCDRGPLQRVRHIKAVHLDFKRAGGPGVEP